MNTKKNKNLKLTKKLKPTNELCVEFSEEELDQLGLKQGDKLSVYPQKDGSILFEKYATMELDTNEWPREILEHLISMSCEKDISVNDVINDLLLQFLELSGYSADDIDEDEEWEDSCDDESEENEFQEGLAFLPMSVFKRIDAIVSEYESQKSKGKEPCLDNLAQFLSIAYGYKFPSNQVKAVVEMHNEDATPHDGLHLNFHQRVQNIIFAFDDLKEKNGRAPSVWELTDYLNQAGVSVKRHQVSAILEINEEKPKHCSFSNCCR